MKLIFAMFFRKPRKAAIPVIWLAVAKDVEGKPFDYLFLMSRRSIDPESIGPAKRCKTMGNVGTSCS